MEASVVYHRPRHIQFTLARTLEIEPDCPECPKDDPGTVATCPDCGSKMAYQGRARLRSGVLVHHFECVHSHREVHSLSIVISE
ncbi:MAG TPA: hypothetical protein VKX16_06140 [Chloroflexota bacterium]|nr:hypothetical protein [Chloroflexota bacterium]